MLRSESLDRRITIERATETFNEFNEPVLTWATYATISAARVDAADGEKFAAGQVGSFLVTWFQFRSSPITKAIMASDRVIHDGVVWQIQGPPKETKDGRNRFLEIRCASAGMRILALASPPAFDSTSTTFDSTTLTWDAAA